MRIKKDQKAIDPALYGTDEGGPVPGFETKDKVEIPRSSVELIRANECRSFRQCVSSPTTSSPTYEVLSPTSNVSSPTLICQCANVQNNFFR